MAERRSEAVKGAKEYDPRQSIKLGGYMESDQHVPDPTHQFGTVETSGTAGIADSRIEEVTPIFDVAKQQNLVTAARALDPEDRDVDSSNVVLPGDLRDQETAKEEVRKQAEAVLGEPIEIGGPSMAQRMAAEEGPEAEDKAKAQRKEQGVGKAGPG